MAKITAIRKAVFHHIGFVAVEEDPDEFRLNCRRGGRRNVNAHLPGACKLNIMWLPTNAPCETSSAGCDLSSGPFRYAFPT